MSLNADNFEICLIFALSAKFVGKTCRQNLSAKFVGKTCRQNLSAKLVGKTCRRNLSAKLVGKTYRQASLSAAFAPSLS